MTGSIYDDPVYGDRWRAEDEASIPVASANANVRLNAAIKDAASRGVPLGISGDKTARMITPPPSLDPYHGRVCLGPGLKRNGLGNPRICGRQAVMTLTSGKYEIPKPPTFESEAEKIERMLGWDAYGVGDTGRIPLASGPNVGHIVHGPLDPPGDNSQFVCYFHSAAATKDALHPEDGGTIPDTTPPQETTLWGLENLNPVRQWRVVNSDRNFCSVTDGQTTVMVRTLDYVAYLKENGSLPERGQAL